LQPEYYKIKIEDAYVDSAELIEKATDFVDFFIAKGRPIAWFSKQQVAFDHPAVMAKKAGLLVGAGPLNIPGLFWYHEKILGPGARIPRYLNPLDQIGVVDPFYQKISKDLDLWARRLHTVDAKLHDKNAIFTFAPGDREKVEVPAYVHWDDDTETHTGNTIFLRDVFFKPNPAFAGGRPAVLVHEYGRLFLDIGPKNQEKTGSNMDIYMWDRVVRFFSENYDVFIKSRKMTPRWPVRGATSAKLEG
jgi:hypothetical protein